MVPAGYIRAATRHSVYSGRVTSPFRASGTDSETDALQSAKVTLDMKGGGEQRLAERRARSPDPNRTDAGLTGGSAPYIVIRRGLGGQRRTHKKKAGQRPAGKFLGEDA